MPFGQREFFFKFQKTSFGVKKGGLIKCICLDSPALCIYYNHQYVTENQSENRMDLLAIQLLCMEQEQQSLEDHTRKFLQLEYLANFPD